MGVRERMVKPATELSVPVFLFWRTKAARTFFAAQKRGWRKRWKKGHRRQLLEPEGVEVCV